MTVALTTKNKLGFVDCLIECQLSDDLLHGSWTRCNSMVVSWLLNSVAQEIAVLCICQLLMRFGQIYEPDSTKVMPRGSIKLRSFLVDCSKDQWMLARTTQN